VLELNAMSASPPRKRARADGGGRRVVPDAFRARVVWRQLKVDEFIKTYDIQSARFIGMGSSGIVAKLKLLNHMEETYVAVKFQFGTTEELTNDTELSREVAAANAVRDFIRDNSEYSAVAQSFAFVEDNFVLNLYALLNLLAYYVINKAQCAFLRELLLKNVDNWLPLVYCTVTRLVSSPSSHTLEGFKFSREKYFKRALFSAAYALSVVHAFRCIHGDLYGRNIIIEPAKKHNAVIIDFALSCELKDSGPVGEVRYDCDFQSNAWNTDSHFQKMHGFEWESIQAIDVFTMLYSFNLARKMANFESSNMPAKVKNLFDALDAEPKTRNILDTVPANGRDLLELLTESWP